ncbi:RagB/SusD family nutrient uptake outer membrane protein [Pedobacter sp. ASV12]|uniref:RagB/SusD family nutrient uptake outer membrane protein n=1 Tax=Pedobacter sp. ASV12 TaxID=2795120 RepID=UPI0018ED8312|nr:RagB/SusD family nutrient uptake outer membrane protein [Pedobacter sp. ASV12]
MKKIVIALLMVVAGVMIYSCKKVDILDPQLNTDLNEETTFADSAKTSNFLFGIYSDIFFDFSSRYYNSPNGSSITAGTAEACDEGNHRLFGVTQPFVVIYSGSLASVVSSGTNQNPYIVAYNKPYANIRRVNIFLSNVDKSPFSAAMKKQTKAEARFLRAWYYSILIKHFGGVALIGDRLFGPNDIIDNPRNSYEECVNYIVSELDAITNDLPANYNAQNYGRITSISCKALKSRVLLFAASPLFNGGNIGKTEAQKKVVGYAAYDANRWVKAAAAAKEALDAATAEGYGLYEDNSTPGLGFGKVFTMRKNPEFLLNGMTAGSKTLEGALLPVSRGVTTPQAMPSQNLVDAFGTINGKPITTDIKSPTNPTGYDAANPYVNRDPRLGYTVIWNQMLWFNNATGNKQPVSTYINTQDGWSTKSGEAGLTYATGYYWRKMMDDGTANNGGPTLQRVWGLIRYAEVMLNYAEASNEAGNITPAYDQLKLLRKRAGILAGTDGLYGLKAGMSQAEMREVIQNERQVELAYEGMRFFDVRRWKLAMEKFNFTMMGMQITKTGSTYTYAKVPITNNPNRVFKEANYFFPLDQTELNRVPALIQNPGY